MPNDNKFGKIEKKAFEKATSMPIFQKVSAAVLTSMPKAEMDFNRSLLLKSGYTCQKYPTLVSCFGCEGDKHAPIVFADGSYLLRDRGNLVVTFGVNKINGKIKWYNKEGFLPCFVSKYSKGNMQYTVESFADCVEINNNKYEIAYSRVTVRNKGLKAERLPVVSSKLVPLNTIKVRFIEAGHTVIMDFCIGADRFGKDIKYPPANILKAYGGFDRHYKRMKEYWLKRLDNIVNIDKLPNKKLINAYKAGYIYTMIVKDGFELNVGENGYDRVFDHDIIGILSTLVTLGDTKYFSQYAQNILKNIQYADARWKYSWPFAQYLLKTGNTDFIRENFKIIKENVHYIEKDRENNGKGIMKKTNAVDSAGNWTIDNWSALTGLAAYRYICERLNENDELQWAENQYKSLFDDSNRTLTETIKKYDINYIPIEMTVPNEKCARNDRRDANWASMFLFGRWGWEGYLLGAEQSGVMIDKIDETYESGFERRKEISDSIYNFGGYPHGYYCSSYNAGYGSTALRGEKHRDLGIRAYEFMIDNAQSGPYSWWEGIDYPDKNIPWSINSCCSGAGSCPHMWGQSTATKVLIDSLIAEKADGTLIIGRGIPDEWIESGERIRVSNYPIAENKHVGYTLHKQADKIILNFSGNKASCKKIVLDLMYFRNKNVFTDNGTFDKENSVLTLTELNGKIEITVS